MLRGDVQASEQRSGKLLGEGVKPPRDAGETRPLKGRGRGHLTLSPHNI